MAEGTINSITLSNDETVEDLEAKLDKSIQDVFKTPRVNPPRKRMRRGESPESLIKNRQVQLDEETPKWAKTMVDNLQKMFISLEKKSF